MLCCAKTGVQLTRCEEKKLINVNTPASQGYSNDTVIYTGILPFVAQNSRHEDNFDEAGIIKYHTYILMLDEEIYHAKNWKLGDKLAYNDSTIGMNTIFNPLALYRQGVVYSVRELMKSLKTSKKYREVKIRFDYV